jgi:hypothetical protein
MIKVIEISACEDKGLREVKNLERSMHAEPKDQERRI